MSGNSKKNRNSSITDSNVSKEKIQTRSDSKKAGLSENNPELKKSSDVKKKKGRLRSIFLKSFLVLMVFSGIFFWFFTRSVPVTISRETTYLTEPLTPQGNVDYFQWLRSQYPPEMKTESNGARDILLALGPGPDYSSAITPEIRQKRIDFLCSELGIDQPIKPKFQFESLRTAHARLFKERNPNFSQEVVDDLAQKNRPQFGSGGFYAFIDREEKFAAEWIRNNSPALDAAALAVDKKIIRFPYNKMFDSELGDDQPLITMLLPDLPLMRSLCRTWAFRASMRVRKGDLQGAFSDFVTIRKMAACLEKLDKACLVEFLIGAAEEQIAFTIPFGANPKAQPNRELLLALQKDLRDNRPRFDWRRSLEVERVICLDFICRFSRGDTRHLEKKFTSKLFLVPGYDWNCVLKEFNELFDQYAKNPPSFPLDQMTYTSPGWDFFTQKGRSRWVARYFIGLLSPNQKLVYDRLDRISDLRVMMEIWTALELYRLDHGTWPPAFTVDSTGKPLHNWRVLLLPYLGHSDLFQKIRLNEPWDSPYNCQFHKEAVLGEFAVIVSPDGPFDRSGKGKIPNPSDPKFILSHRKDLSICWMKPDAEIPIERARNWQEEVGVNNGVFVLRSDGAAGELRKNSNWKSFGEKKKKSQ